MSYELETVCRAFFLRILFLLLIFNFVKWKILSEFFYNNLNLFDKFAFCFRINVCTLVCVNQKSCLFMEEK